MRKLIFTTLMFGLAVVVQGQVVNDWENPQVVGINKEPYRATLTLPSKRPPITFSLLPETLIVFA